MRTFVHTSLVLGLLAWAAVLAACGGGSSGGSSAGAPILPVPFNLASFSGHAIDNPFFPLVPGTVRVYRGDTADGVEQGTVTVTNVTRTILGVVCIEVHDVVTLNGSVIEDTLDWFAQDDAGNVWYFGEDSKEIENGIVVSTAGSFEAGQGGALAGIAMLASPVVGTTYSQEFFAGVAEDMATVQAVGQTVVIGLGTYTGCLRTRDFTPLEPGNEEAKHYAPGIGAVLEVNSDGERLELISKTP